MVPVSIALSNFKKVGIGRDANPLFARADDAAAELLFSLDSEDGKISLALQAQNVQTHDRWVKAIRHLISSRSERRAEAEQAAKATPYRVMSPGSVRVEFAAMSERTRVLSLGEEIMVTKVVRVTEADIPEVDDGAGIGGGIDMGHFPVGTERAFFDGGWVSVTAGNGTLLLQKTTTRKMTAGRRALSMDSEHYQPSSGFHDNGSTSSVGTEGEGDRRVRTYCFAMVHSVNTGLSNSCEQIRLGKRPTTGATWQ